MSKEILKALIQLFAIFAKQDDGVSKGERDTVYSFLKNTLQISSAQYYIDEFDRFAGISKSTHEKRKSLVSDSTKTLRICAEINKELTGLQKVIVTIRLLEMISSGGKKMTENESDFLQTTVEIFNISKLEFETLQEFVFTDRLYDLDYPNMLIVDSKQINDKKKSKHLYNEHLEGSIGILRIESEDIYLTKYVGTQELFLNGVNIKIKSPYVFRNGSSIRGAKIDSIYFSDIVSEFRKDISEDNISFIAKDICYEFPNGTKGLRNIEINEKGGQIIGFLGASGAGKSTLLNVLNGIEKPSHGTVKINGVNIHTDKDNIEGIIGYIPQDDLLIESLTVFENLYFSAKLCFSNKPKSEIETLVLTTISKLGLRDIKDLRVGSVLDKTISGGQRKRVNIGLELLREPKVLFVDEPTSGLSSMDSENIMDLLKELALSGKVVFVVIHQPSSDIFKLFDRILILDKGGYPIFYGNPVDSAIYFKQQTNQINAEEGECSNCGNVNPEQIFNIIETKVIDEYGHFTEFRKIDPEDWNKAYLESLNIPENIEVTETLKSDLKIPNKLMQIWIFISRDVLAKLSNKQYMIINAIEAPFLAFILAFIIRFYNTSAGKHDYQFSLNENISAYIFISIIVALFMGLSVSAEEIIKDRKILKREEFLNLSWGSYLFSKLWILFSLSAFQTLSFVLIGNFILEIRGLHMEYWLILFSISCLSNLMGLNISASFKSVVTIYILIPILLIPQLILSGVVVKFDRLNPHVSSAKYVPVIGDIMGSRWAFEALAVTQIKDNEYAELVYEFDKALGVYEFEKIYHIPHLDRDLDYCIHHFDDKDELFSHKLKVIKAELTKMLADIEGAEYENIDKINAADFNSEIAEELRLFLLKAKKYYVTLYNSVQDQKDEQMTAYRNDSIDLIKLKREYHNDALEAICKNVSEQTRIFESEGELIQKIYPIYQSPSFSNPLNYRTQFLFPSKNLFGSEIDTFWFNIIVIWSMSFFLFLALYYRWLEKFIELFSKSTS